MVKLGQKARDIITGFEGIVIGRAEYLYGCAQYGLMPPVVDGRLTGSEWFDEGRIEVIGVGVAPEQVRGAKPGGPNRDAPR